MLHFETLRQKGFIFFDRNPVQKIFVSKSLIFKGLEKSLKIFAKKCKKKFGGNEKKRTFAIAIEF